MSIQFFTCIGDVRVFDDNDDDDDGNYHYVILISVQSNSALVYPGVMNGK